MESSPRAYTVLPCPSERRVVLDAMVVGRKKFMIHGLYEADVTAARQILRRRGLSHTAYLVACVGRTVARHKMVHAYPDWRGRLIAFDDVDVTVIVEVESGGRTFPLAHILRAADRRSVAEISREIRAVRSAPRSSPSGRLWRRGKALQHLPGFLRRLLYRALLRDPRRLQRFTGTVTVTSVGMFGRGGGYGIAVPTVHNFSVVVGGISERPTIVDGELVRRQLLHLTLSFNHVVIDGAPAARAADELRRLIESTSLLDDPAAPADDRRRPDAPAAAAGGPEDRSVARHHDQLSRSGPRQSARPGVGHSSSGEDEARGEP